MGTFIDEKHESQGFSTIRCSLCVEKVNRAPRGYARSRESANSG